MVVDFYQMVSKNLAQKTFFALLDFHNTLEPFNLFAINFNYAICRIIENFLDSETSKFEFRTTFPTKNKFFELMTKRSKHWLAS